MLRALGCQDFFAAVFWACQLCNQRYESLLEVCFHFDCMFAGMAVQGLWKADALRPLLHWVNLVGHV